MNTATDLANCGECGNVCASGTCTNGTCGAVVTSGVIGWASVSGDGVTTTTGGEGGEVVSVSSASELESAVGDETARIVQMSGSISIGELEIRSNKTLVGVDSNATFNGGLQIDGSQNIIVQKININATSSAANQDGIHIQGSHHIWIDHVEIWDAPDGNLDINDASNWITVSWSIFRYSSSPPADDHRYSNLIGSGSGDTQDRGRLKVTYHHNWWADRVHERMPRVRFGQVHVFNNYYTSSGNNYCVRAGFEADLLVENNYFEGVSDPHEIDTGEGAITALEANGNTYDGTSGVTETSGSAFDPPYAYSFDDPSAARSAIQSSAGPQ